MLGGAVAAGQVQGGLRDESLQEPLQQGLPQQLQGGQEEVGGGGEEGEVGHQLSPGLHLPHHLEHGAAQLCVAANHVDLGRDEEAGVEEPHPVAPPHQSPVLLLHLILHSEPLLEVELCEEREGSHHLRPDLALPRLELLANLQPGVGCQTEAGVEEGELGRTDNDGLHHMLGWLSLSTVCPVLTNTIIYHTPHHCQHSGGPGETWGDLVLHSPLLLAPASLRNCWSACRVESALLTTLQQKQALNEISGCNLCHLAQRSPLFKPNTVMKDKDKDYYKKMNRPYSETGY